MTVNELIRKLRQWPGELEVLLDIDGRLIEPKLITMDQGGASSWIAIMNIPEVEYEGDSST